MRDSVHPRSEIVVSTASEWWHAPVFFAIHVVIGTAIFALVAGTAFSLAILVKWLELKELEGPLVWGLKIGEYAIFICDLVLFLLFLWRAFQRAWREL